ncbi:MAG: hypothetical protein WC622_02540 [Pedobacter sp.]|jgi:hypothetical protein|uniref:hypothetical protein n=1 Tax=Pedobacter sp. TaxID=1411316 RepID=UPI0035681EA3
MKTTKQNTLRKKVVFSFNANRPANQFDQLSGGTHDPTTTTVTSLPSVNCPTRGC